jgi:hypothetical protein
LARVCGLFLSVLTVTSAAGGPGRDLRRPSGAVRKMG